MVDSNWSIVSDEFNITIGSSGGATLTASFSFDTAGGAGEYVVECTWQYFDGTYWIGTQYYVQANMVRYYDAEFGQTMTLYEGSLTNNDSRAATAGSTQKYRLLARKVSGPAGTIFLSGQATAQG